MYISTRLIKVKILTSCHPSLMGFCIYVQYIHTYSNSKDRFFIVDEKLILDNVPSHTVRIKKKKNGQPSKLPYLVGDDMRHM